MYAQAGTRKSPRGPGSGADGWNEAPQNESAEADRLRPRECPLRPPESAAQHTLNSSALGANQKENSDAAVPGCHRAETRTRRSGKERTADSTCCGPRPAVQRRRWDAQRVAWGRDRYHPRHRRCPPIRLEERDLR